MVTFGDGLSDDMQDPIGLQPYVNLVIFASSYETKFLW